MKGHVKFVRNRDVEDELVYNIINKDEDELGQIYYHQGWNKYVFELGGNYFDRDCLNQIVGFLFHLDYEKARFKEK